MSTMRVFAFACHPDDIEFMMSGTLFLLKDIGCEIHYMNLANGSCGTTEYDRDEIVAIRRKEGQNAARYLGAEYHESLSEDLGVFYTQDLIRRVTALVREIEPDIMFVQSPQDYMEDHMNTTRVGVTAAFCRGMRNFETIPLVAPILKDVVVYHALPYGLQDGLGNDIYPRIYIDVTGVIDKKDQMLRYHDSQKKWLDESQGLDSYIDTMKDMAKQVGTWSERYTYAEGWRRHSHLGFCAPDAAPLESLLKDYCYKP